MAIIKRGNITSRKQVATLGCIDWSRLNGYWDEPSEAIDCIASWLVNTCSYSIMRTNLLDAPERNDFPGWRHVGGHVPIGKAYWNWFHSRYRGTLHLADQPDINGTFTFSDGEQHRFYGDIGTVSPSTFSHTIHLLTVGDLWISVLDEFSQIIIEPYISLRGLYDARMAEIFGKQEESITLLQKPSQLPLF